MTDIFISYARVDLALAEPIRVRLEALGLATFFDITQINAGDTFPNLIAAAMEESKAVLACWTPRALESPWCQRECHLARAHNKLVPVALDQFMAVQLKTFIDISYENLIDLGDAHVHSGWARTLVALARKFETWAEHTSSDEGAADALAKAHRLRSEAHAASPPMQRAERHHSRETLWQDLKNSTDSASLLRFADNFHGSEEAFQARQRAVTLRQCDEDFERLDQSSLPSIAAFLTKYKNDHRSPELEAIREALRHDQDVKLTLKREKAEATHKLALIQAETDRERARATLKVEEIQAAAQHEAATAERLRQEAAVGAARKAGEIQELRKARAKSMLSFAVTTGTLIIKLALVALPICLFVGCGYATLLALAWLSAAHGVAWSIIVAVALLVPTLKIAAVCLWLAPRQLMEKFGLIVTGPTDTANYSPSRLLRNLGRRFGIGVILLALIGAILIGVETASRMVVSGQGLLATATSILTGVIGLFLALVLVSLANNPERNSKRRGRRR